MAFRRWTYTAVPSDKSWESLAKEYNDKPEHFWTRRGAVRNTNVLERILGGAVQFDIVERGQTK